MLFFAVIVVEDDIATAATFSVVGDLWLHLVESPSFGLRHEYDGEDEADDGHGRIQPERTMEAKTHLKILIAAQRRAQRFT